MAKHHGKSGVIKAITSTGTPAAVGEVKSFELNTAADLVDVSKIGTTAKEYLTGQTEWSGSLECYYDPSDGAQADLIEGASVDMLLACTGETSGYETFTGTAVVTGCSITVNNNEAVMYNVTFTGNGALTRGTVVA